MHHASAQAKALPFVREAKSGPAKRGTGKNPAALLRFSIWARACEVLSCRNMELFHRILRIAMEGSASDVHLKVGTPVIFRIHRNLVAIECPFPTEDWM